MSSYALRTPTLPAASVVVVGAGSPRRAAILATIEDKGHFVVAVHRDLDLALGDFARVRPQAAVLDLDLPAPAALASAIRLKATRPGLAVALVVLDGGNGLAGEVAASGIRLIPRSGARAATGLADLAAFLATAAMSTAEADPDMTSLAATLQPAWTRLPAQGVA